jgi:hypothetical protein
MFGKPEGGTSLFDAIIERSITAAVFRTQSVGDRF